MRRSSVLIAAGTSFIAGVAGASYLPESVLGDDSMYAALAVGAGSAAVLGYRYYRGAVHAAPLFVCACTALLGVWRYSLSVPQFTPLHVAWHNGSERTIEARVVGEPDVSPRSMRLKLGDMYLVQTGARMPLEGYLLAITSRFPEVRYGDRIVVRCSLEAPQPIDGFAYDRYLARQGVYSICPFPTLQTIQATPRSSSWYALILSVKQSAANLINAGLVEPYAGLLRGMLLGDRRGVPGDVQDAFNVSGLSHLVAISGMNMTLFAAVSMQGLLWLGLWRRQAFSISAIVIILYTVLIGLPASAVRASIMALILLSMLAFGRLSRPLLGIVYAAVLMLMVQPRAIRDDVGFQLSFVAILGVVYLYPRLLRITEYFHIPSSMGVRDIFLMTLAAQLASAPVIVPTFQTTSLIAPVANILTVWLMPFILVYGLAALALSWLIGAAWLWFAPLRAVLWYIITVAQAAARLPYAAVETDGWEWFYVSATVAVIGVVVYYSSSVCVLDKK